MSTILANRESDLNCRIGIKSIPKTVTKLEHKLEPNLMPKSSTVFIEVSDLKQMCVSGIKCDKRMCLVDLKDVYNIKKYFGNNLICDECLDYLNYTREYSDDHLMRWTAVKTTEYLRLYLRLIEKIGCGCTYDDCKVKECDLAEQIQMNQNFRSILFNYAFESLPLTSVEMGGFDEID